MPEAWFWVFVTVFLAAFVVHTRNGIRRIRAWNERLEVFGRRFGLVSQKPKAAPDPRLRKFLSAPASYPRWMEGRYNGVRVVAFDYRIGWRYPVLGSGVGVERLVLETDCVRLPSWPKLKVAARKGWTFLYAEKGDFSPFRMMEAEEMEQLWQMLLMAPAQQPELAEPVPAGVHIRPRRLA